MPAYYSGQRIVKSTINIVVDVTEPNIVDAFKVSQVLETRFRKQFYKSIFGTANRYANFPH